MSPTTLVVGANRGLGLEFVRQLAGKEGKVLATARDVSGAKDLVELQKSSPEGRVELLPLDFTSQSSVEAFASKLPKIDVAIINAGTNGDRSPLISEHDMSEDLVATFEVNVLGPIRTVKALLPYLSKGSKVVLLSSRLASMTESTMDLSPSYSISKAALNMAGRKFAVELKEKGITVIIQAPGWVKTAMGGDNAPLEPHQSISGMLENIERVGLEQSGEFYDWNGKKMDW